MIGLSLNDNTRAAALDGALAMSVLLHNQRDLTLASARSSVTGLITAIREAPDNYARLLDASSAAVTALESAAERLVSPPWTPADAETTDAIAAAVQAQLPDDEEDLADHPLHALAGKTPVTYELPRESSSSLFVSTWGDSGAISLTDATGHGIVIHHDGRVDAVPSSGHGWQFKSDATFLLPDGTKVSVSPETPASVLLTRGEQRLAIEGLAPGASPEVDLADSGGLDADAARNDGHIFVMGATPRTWTLAGAAVGQEDDRETVASAPIENELPVDVSKVQLPDDLAGRIAALGLDAATFDTDHDGLFSHGELLKIVQAIDSAIGGAQTKFEGAMGQIGDALAPLLRLARFIEKALGEAERKHTERKQNSAEEREQLRLIQRDLDAARNALRLTSGSQGAGPPVAQSNPPPVVLNRPSDTAPTTVPPSSALPESGAASPQSIPASPVSEEPAVGTELSSLRRAQRLLGGFSGAQQYAKPEPQASSTDSLPPLSDQTVPKHREGSSPSTHSPSEKLGSGEPAPRNAPARPGVSDPATTPRSDKRTSVSERALHSPADLPGINPAPAGASSASMATAPEGDAKPNPYASVERRPPADPLPIDPGAAGRGQVRRRLDDHLALHRDHVSRMRQLQDELRHVVTMLFSLVGQDDQLRAVFRADDLSDAQRSEFRARIAELEHEVGIGWGDSLERTPPGEARLHARVLASGMMI